MAEIVGRIMIESTMAAGSMPGPHKVVLKSGIQPRLCLTMRGRRDESGG